jgi:hypothetical protein
MSTEGGKGREEAEMDKEVKRESGESGTKGNSSSRNEKILNVKLQKILRKKGYILVKTLQNEQTHSLKCM